MTEDWSQEWKAWAQLNTVSKVEESPTEPGPCWQHQPQWEDSPKGSSHRAAFPPSPGQYPPSPPQQARRLLPGPCYGRLGVVALLPRLLCSFPSLSAWNRLEQSGLWFKNLLKQTFKQTPNQGVNKSKNPFWGALGSTLWKLPLKPGSGQGREKGDREN